MGALSGTAAADDRPTSIGAVIDIGRVPINPAVIAAAAVNAGISGSARIDQS